jgi:putative ABC transport system substrate-binding protein
VPSVTPARDSAVVRSLLAARPSFLNEAAKWGPGSGPFISTVAGGLLAAPLAGKAQQLEKVWRIGLLGPAAERAYTDPVMSLRAGLRDLGYFEGNNIVFEYRFAEDKYERLLDLAAELVRSKVDVIVAHATLGTSAAKRATSTIPIVMVGVADPVGTGFVSSLARPGGNITGVSNNDVGLAAKRLGLLKEVLPKLSLVAVLRNPTSPVGELQFRETQAAARSLGIELQLVDARDPKELDSAFPVMVKGRWGTRCF